MDSVEFSVGNEGLVQEKIDQVVRLEVMLEQTTDAVSPGDLFVFPLPVDLPLEWLVVFSHPDDPTLWFVVPADQNPQVGPSDLLIPETVSGDNHDLQYGPLSLRCGRGLWISSGEFDRSLRSGSLDSKWTRTVRSKLRQLVQGNLPMNEEQQATASDPNYEEWLDKIAFAVELLEQKLHAAVGMED